MFIKRDGRRGSGGYECVRRRDWRCVNRVCWVMLGVGDVLTKGGVAVVCDLGVGSKTFLFSPFILSINSLVISTECQGLIFVKASIC